jgi:predicted nucleotidyltransferase
MELLTADTFLHSNPRISTVITGIPKQGVYAVYLFGSYARGTARPTSDIDLCVITDPDLPRTQRDAMYSFSSRDIQISLFWDLPPAVRIRVLRDGLLLWGQDSLTLHRMKVHTVRSYLGTQRLLRRHMQEALG